MERKVEPTAFLRREEVDAWPTLPLRQSKAKRGQLQELAGAGLKDVVFDGTIQEMPDLVRFFVGQADYIQFVSFLLQAGTKRCRDAVISQERMMRNIASGTGIDLDFEMPRIGHSDCNKYTGILVADDASVLLFDDRRLWSELFA